MRELQGFAISGNPLRIEFAKAVSFVHLCLFLICISLAFVYSVCMLPINYEVSYLNAIPAIKHFKAAKKKKHLVQITIMGESS